MSESPAWAPVFAVAATVFGVLASALMGMANARLAAIDKHLDKMNGQLFAHLIDAKKHDAGLAELRGRIENATGMAKKAHERIDAVKERIGG